MNQHHNNKHIRKKDSRFQIWLSVVDTAIVGEKKEAIVEDDILTVQNLNIDALPAGEVSRMRLVLSTDDLGEYQTVAVIVVKVNIAWDFCISERGAL